jgi:hypothetical protein
MGVKRAEIRVIMRQMPTAAGSSVGLAVRLPPRVFVLDVLVRGFPVGTIGVFSYHLRHPPDAVDPFYGQEPY